MSISSWITTCSPDKTARHLIYCTLNNLTSAEHASCVAYIVLYECQSLYIHMRRLSRYKLTCTVLYAMSHFA